MIFAGYTGSKNPVWNRLKIQFVELDFYKLIFQKSIRDPQRVKLRLFDFLPEDNSMMEIPNVRSDIDKLKVPEQTEHYKIYLRNPFKSLCSVEARYIVKT